MSLITTLEPIYERVRGGLDRLQPWLLLAVRIDWGFQFAQDGWGKLHNLSHVTEFFTSLGLPAPHATAIFCGSVEFVGGLLLILGLFSRVNALVLFVNMTVAYWTAERDAFAHFFTDPGKFSSADAYAYWFVALLILIFGPGALALDTWLRRRVGGG
jgi:putative oxidoreductase